MIRQDTCSGSVAAPADRRVPKATGKNTRPLTRGETTQAMVALSGVSAPVSQRKSIQPRRKAPKRARSIERMRQLWVPAGMAHGFVVLSDTADFLYKTTDYYAPEHERSIAWDDDAIGIDWPLAAHGIDAPLLSDKDRAALPLSEAECFE